MKFPGKIRKTAACFLLFCIVLACIPVHAEENEAVEISAPSGVLMEPETKTILYEKDKDTRRSPASVTKVMTLLLIFDHLKDGSLKLTDTVTTSAHAKSMGGSQVFLEEGETQDVETMIKCIVVASGNDASVAMAEHIAGSEEAFVKEMNARAEGLGMENTHFVDCCGLTDSDEHYTTAYDIALMSRELILNYPEIFQYSFDLDGKYHSRYQTGKQRIRTHQHESTDPYVFRLYRTQNGKYQQSGILPERGGREE